MTHDDDLERIEQALDALSGRLATRRPWDELAPRVRRRLRGPTWRLIGWVVLTAVLAAVALRHEELWVPVAFMGLVVLPGEIQAALERRRSLGTADTGELLGVYAADLRRVEARLVARFVVDPFLIFGLLVLATLSRWPLVPVSLAALLVVRIVWTACVSLARTRRELVALGDDDEPLDAEEPRLASEVEDDPDESWPKLLLGLAVLYVQVFFLYVGPFLAVLAGVVAWRAEAPTKPAVVAAVLALGAALAWWRAPERAEEAR